ncbi:hypothetical protein C8F01DRAFT_1205345 [Mycena amicta]|nr:hypothetical protein C8F01DRAFT_1205345 [Mycena amicta]
MSSTLELLEDTLDSMLESLESMPSTISQIIADITRYGPPLPSFPDIHLPTGLGDFEIPPPPRHTSPTWLQRSVAWAQDNPRKLVGGLLGTGLIVYGAAYMRKLRARKMLKEKSNERRQVVGGDAPLALPLVLDLERKGYIVITSVSTADLGADLERRSKGYVRALVLDPNDIPNQRCRRSIRLPSSHPYIHSVISLLSLTPPLAHAPLEHISLRSAYLPYLNATHVVPLQVIQALLPMLRTGPTRGRAKKSIIVCLPATAARVALPFNAMQSMSVASTLRAVEVLRREVHIAALTDKSEAMKNIRVVVADVGAFNIGPLDTFLAPPDAGARRRKLTYGPSFASLSHSVAEPATWRASFDDNHSYGVPRKPTDVSVFVNSIVGTVSNGQFGLTVFGVGLGLGRLRNYIRGERFSVGAGASTYKFASFLPPVLLDVLINIPHLLISIRNALLPTQPFVRPPRTLPAVESANAQREPAANMNAAESDSAHELSEPETGSEADVESNSGDHPAIGGGSWVSLKMGHAEGA